MIMTMENIEDRVIGFLGGNIIATITTMISGAEALKVVILGVLGGLAGMLARDIYKYIKSKING